MRIILKFLVIYKFRFRFFFIVILCKTILKIMIYFNTFIININIKIFIRV